MLITAVLLLGVLIPLTAFSVSAKEETIGADAMNTDRGTGQLIIFTSDFGASTGTNEWGYEVTVGADNVVTKVGGNNSQIPSGGFVLSGHDAQESGKPELDKKTFLMENVEVGDYIIYNSTSMIVTISDEPIHSSSYYDITRALDGVNGTRSTDFLVIYTNKGTRTGTNEWGYEVIIEDGRVAALGGNDNLIPNSDNSFVISGHGTSAEWLKLNAKLGMKASFDAEDQSITFEYDAEAAAIGIIISLENLEQEYQKALESYSYVSFGEIRSRLDAASESFDTVHTEFVNGGEASEFEKTCNEVLAAIDEIKLMLSESRTVEYRGVWIRPTQTTEKAVDDYVQELYDNGINHIFIETLYAGTMIMPMPEDSLFEQNPSWKGFDMLQAFIDSCHKRDMELHIWMTVFYVGHPDSTKSLGTKKPEWLAVHNKGGNYTPASDGATYQFINPANQEAVDYLLETYKYIFENYNIDGFQLDYIRYFHRDADYDYGYDDITLDAFENKYGVRPSYDTNASYWNDWVAFRAQYVTDIVVKIRDLIDEVRPSVLLSASVGADIEGAFNNIYQDYMNWLDEGYLDILNPMAYGDGYSSHIARQAENCGDSVLLGVGRSTQMPEFFAWDMLRLAKEANDAGADGTVYFEASSFLKKGTGSVLLNSIYRNRAITPTLDKTAAIKASLEYAIGRIDDVIIPLEGIDQSKAESIKSLINAIIADADGENDLTQGFEALITEVNTVENENAQSAMLKDLLYARKIANVANRVPDRIDVSRGESEDESPDASGESSDDASKESDFPWIIVIVAAVVLIIAAGGVLFARKKNK